MRIGKTGLAASLALVTWAGLAVPASAGVHGHWHDGWHQPQEPVTVLTGALSGPFGLSVNNGRAIVAESGSGEVSLVRLQMGEVSPLATGLASPAAATPARGVLAIVTGGAEVPDASITGDSTVFVQRNRRHDPVPIADLEAYELANNPDGQLQFDPTTHKPLDALSNPFAIIADRSPHGFVLVADAGANDVLRVSRNGDISTFFVPPLVTTGLCEGAPNNDPDHVGCDPVPTGLAYGPGNRLYVSTLSAETPGEGRVYVLNGRTGAVLDVMTGFDAPTGVAVAPDGTVYVSEVMYGAPAGDGPPPADFDPSTIGRIVRVDRCNGERTYAQVTQPTGLAFDNGHLYSTAWSVGSFFGQPDAGQIVQVNPSAFHPAPAPAQPMTPAQKL